MFCKTNNRGNNKPSIFYKVFLVLAIMPFWAPQVKAQVSVTARLDSLQLFVGQQNGLELEVTMPAGKNLLMPVLKKGMEIIPNIEVVDVHDPDTVLMNDGKQLQIIQRYVITAWDSSFYYLPPMQVMIDSVVHESKPLVLKVYTMEVDTLNADKFFPPRGIQKLPFTWDDWKQIAYTMLWLIPLIGLLIVLLDQVKKGKPIFRLVRREKKIPPHQVAITEIERIKEQRTWAQEDSKEYYTLLTDALRTYIQDRYGFSAMEMTSAEIIERLTQDGDQNSLNELREIFRTADLVKFAKWSTRINENDANLVAALQYVNETKVEEDPNQKPEPEVIKETNKQRQIHAYIIRFLILGCSMAMAYILMLVIRRLIDMFA